MRYRRLSFALPPAAEEQLAARLWAAGTLGLELRDGDDGRLRIDAWFAEPPPPAAGSGGGLAEVELLGSERVGERDWMAEYRRRARPLRLGPRLVVDPRDEAPATRGGGAELRLHLPARRAFGTGSHASTRLAVELLEELPLAGRVVLDLGTGTGILALVAAARGAARVVALDRDPVAALIAADNRRRNRLWPAVAAGGLDCLAGRRLFDLALVNIRPEHVAAELGALARRLLPGADAIFSGLLAGEGEGWAARLGAHGLEVTGRRRRGEWLALAARLGR